MMNLDAAIKYAEEVAEFSDRECMRERFYGEKEMKRKCAEEHRQLAEWLKELKRFKAHQCKSCNEYDCEEDWCYKHGIDRSYDDFCSDWED